MVTTEELLKLLKEIAEERIPFNKVLGLTIQTMDEEHMQVKFDMLDELVGNIMRTGNRVSVVRMELENDQKQLIAVGTGTYIVG